jgi:hypothetical protein
MKLRVRTTLHLLFVVGFKVFGLMFRPKWYIGLQLGSVSFVITYSYMIYIGEQTSATSMLKTVIFSFLLAYSTNIIAYTVRWGFLR